MTNNFNHKNGISIIPPFQQSLNKSSSKISEQTPESYSVEEIIIEDDEGSYYEEIIVDDDDEEGEYIIEEIIDDDYNNNLPLIPPRRPTKLSFDEYDEIQFTLNLDEYSDTELDDSWYKRPEYDKMVSTAKKLIEKEEKHQQTNGKRIRKKIVLFLCQMFQ